MDNRQEFLFAIVKGKDMITTKNYAICVQKGGSES